VELTRRSRRWLRVQGVFFAILLFVAVGLAAWLTSRIQLSFDWTEVGRNSLTRASRKIVRSLPHRIEILAFVRSEDPLRPAIRHLINRYRRVDPKITLRFINPDIHLAEVRKLGIGADGELVIRYAGRSENLTTLSQTSITDALFRLGRSQSLWVRFVTGSGEPSISGAGPGALGAFAKALEREGFKLKTLDLATEAIPPKTALLVLADPTVHLLPSEIQTLIHYVHAGGALLWLMEPGPLEGLAPLARTLGIRLYKGVIVDATSRLFGISNPAWLVLTAYPENPVTTNLKAETLFPDAGALGVRPHSHWIHETLVKSRPLPVSWLETGSLKGTLLFNPKIGDRAGPLPVGMLLTHPARRGYPGTDRVAVVADTNFLANAFLNEGGNQALGLNLFNWLTQQTADLKLHEPTSKDRTLTLTNLEEALLGLGFLLLIPATLFGFGLWTWIRRRRR